jgi:hypothetical protein|tara:strand:+ start:8991 stop:9236 length:246 start_codon:yes stop_codon:yes gene_type:complete
MNMVERIARAICAARYERHEFGRVVDELWVDHLREARAVLVALEHPTDCMIRYGKNASSAGSLFECEDIFVSMIQSAQDEK